MSKSRVVGLVSVVVAAAAGIAGGVVLASQFGWGSSSPASAHERTVASSSPGSEAGATGVGSPLGPAPAVSVNASGQSYGSMVGRESFEAAPDLVLVVGNSGKEGYVRKGDILTAMPSSPADALRMAAAAKSASTVPVFDFTGKNVIDTYTLQPPIASSSTP